MVLIDAKYTQPQLKRKKKSVLGPVLGPFKMILKV